ncbi:putative F-box/LRR-repeat protein At5g41840 [Sesamum indicum]|uniref:F-box/LRR-repeat protein At5g41840 n=1 Tax=Sesamum indicum TaxID=4182 RepID=A0A6I9STK7_SESIN|nr:putative F-box/LRR-repeat protein At5g41840 [Sesamum indicum]XP_011073430.1 putative F-box/LRR-repeat protein At5g41840 [Sesamum indicum]XP_020548459.1 putative F-box/LRR-repeat protein At5g41840 [Sesamum indicum]XP_020548460.1 putative F-box/LRR-repeat protein At5g41840 [Sesamum indicum]
MDKHLRSPERAPVDGETMDDADADGIDRISNLPNEILCHILSFLPTKYAVATSILSTKWKNLFPLIPNLRLRLDDSLLLHPESTPETYLVSFMNFVDRLLNVTLHDVPSIYAFCLICQKFDDGGEIANWVQAALRLNVNRMDLRIRGLRNSNFLFDSLFGCNIVSLNLLLDFADDAPECRFSLPNLKMLSVQYMKFNAVNVLLECCPVLEYLVVYNCYCNPGEMLRICIPSLMALKLVNGVNCLEGELELDAPNLEYFNYGGFLATRFLAKTLKCLRIARLDLDENVSQYPYESDEQAAKLIKVCSDAEKLWLSENVVIMLHHCPHPLPRFRKLVALAIKIMEPHGWELLPSLLNCAPNLKKLYLKAGFDVEQYEIFKASLDKSFSICLSQRSETCFLLEIQREVEN